MTLAKALLLIAASLPLRAATIVSVTGTVNFGGSVGVNQTQTAGFSTSQLYSDVVISALISGPAADVYTAYLTTTIGPGTTVANQAAVVTQNFPGFNPGALTPIFTGLNLPAASYYLTIFNSATTSGAWSSTNTPTITAAPGAAHVFSGYFITNGNALPYPPAAGFADLAGQGQTLIYSVETATIPEPATASLLTVVLFMAVALGMRAKALCYRRRKTSLVMSKVVLTFLVLVTLVANSAAASTLWQWNYSGLGINSNGTFTTAESPDSNGGYLITGITGTRNGKTITGLQPPGTPIPGNEPFAVDDLVFLGPGAQLTSHGFGFSLSDGTYSNPFYAGFLPVPEFLEFFSAPPFTPEITASEDSELPVRFSATPVPEPSTCLLVVCVSASAALWRRFRC